MGNIDLLKLGATQAAFFGHLNQSYLLPANTGLFPLAEGQFYGQVATNCRVLNTKASTNKGINARNHHRARGAITEVAMVLPNWYVDRSASKLEYPNNAGTICAASIEYPAGVFHRLSFAGSVRELNPGGGYLVSAFLSVAIPDNAEFWTNIWCSAATSVVFFNGATGQVSGNGERGTVSTSDVTDFTVTSNTGTAQVYGLWPLALIGRTSGKACAIIADSLGEGVGDVSDSSDHVGLLARLIGPVRPYINLSQSGDRLELFLQSATKRLELLAYVRSVIFALGVNDIGAGRSLNQIKADLIAVWGRAKGELASGGRVFQTTITPSTTSTDSFATLANQTAAGSFSTAGNGTREQLNDWLRDGAPIKDGLAAAIAAPDAIRSGHAAHPLFGVLEMADTVESSRNSGKWKIDGTAFKWTGDGIHPSNFAYVQAATMATPYLSDLGL